MTQRTRVSVFAGLVTACVIAAVVSILLAARDPAAPARAERAARGAVPLAQLQRDGYLAFRSTELGPDYGRIELAPRDDPSGARTPTNLSCDRVAIAGGRGICLITKQGLVTRYEARLFDATTFRTLGTVRLPGGPSRARVSPDGLRAAYTVFVAGDGYTNGGFSTRTAILDARTGRRLADLERLTVLRDGERIHAVDFNFWGVTFSPTDPKRFFATLGTGGHTYLVQGDLAAGVMRVIHDGVECPSLSPDGTRVAFKQRLPAGSGPLRWRIAVLDLRTRAVRQLSAAHNVDDQVAWLDDDHVMYGVSRTDRPSAVTDVWVEAADASAPPRRLLTGAWSPQAVGPAAAS